VAAGGKSLKQFIFVVSSPEQEADFKAEIAKAQQQFTNCLTYPTMLAFHGQRSTSMSFVADAQGRELIDGTTSCEMVLIISRQPTAG
jgi:hypothetical protein